jgi:hypothetical protein
MTMRKWLFLSSLALFAFAAGCRNAGADNPSAAKLFGKWEETKKLGPGEDPNARGTTKLEVKADGTMVQVFGDGPPMVTKYKVASAKGDELVLKTELQLEKGKSFPADDQRIKLTGLDTMEMTNAANGYGGAYKRVK